MCTFVAADAGAPKATRNFSGAGVRLIVYRATGLGTATTRASLALRAFLRASSPRYFATCAFGRRGRVMVGDVLATPDSLAVRLLDHCRVVEASRQLNVGRFQFGSHTTHSAPRERNRPPMTVWKRAEREICLSEGAVLLRRPPLSRDRPNRDEQPAHRRFFGRRSMLS